MERDFNREALRQRRIWLLEMLAAAVLTAVLTSVLTTTLGCVRVEPQDETCYLELRAGVDDICVIGTKGAPATTPGASFKAWAYAYLSGTAVSGQTPNFLSAEAFNEVGSSTTYQSEHKHGPVPTSYAIRWWALSPASPAGATAPSSSGGYMGFSYTTPSAVSSQSDLMIARASQSGCSNGQGPDPFTFNHILSCLQFQTSATAADVPACTVVSIAVTNVQDAAAWADNGSGGGWGTKSGSATFTITPGKAIASGQTNTQMHTDAESMMLLPQAFTGSSRIQVTVNTGGSDITKEASLSGITLVQGQKCILHLGLRLADELTLSCESINWIE